MSLSKEIFVPILSVTDCKISHIYHKGSLFIDTSLRTKCLEMFYSLPTSQIWKQDVTALDYLFFRFKCLSCYALWIYTKPLVNFLLYYIAVTLYRSWYWQTGNVIERWTQQKVVLNYKPNRTPYALSSIRYCMFFCI